MSLPVQGAWIEILPAIRPKWLTRSLPVQGAWIEIAIGNPINYADSVAPRAGSVD